MLDRLLADDPRNAAALAERGWVEQGYWVLGADNNTSLAINDRARALFDRALAIDPKNAEARLGRLTVERNRAYDLTWTLDRPAEAILVCRAALAQLRAQSWPKEVRDQAELLELHLLNRLGDAVYFAGDVPGSLLSYEEADAAVDRLIVRDGEIPVWRLMKAEIAFNLSGTLQEIKSRLPESLRVAEQGITSLRALERFGLDAGTEKRLVMLLGQKAIILSEMGRQIEAVGPSSESMMIRRKRFAGAPKDPQRTRDVAIAIPNHARILKAAGRNREACAEITEGVRLWRVIRSRGDLGAKDARDELPKTEALQKVFCAN
jgi:serine/threonine-protein kinase